MEPTLILAAAGDKHAAPELLVLIAVPLVLSFVLYKAAKVRVNKGGPRWLLWLSVVPLAFGVYLSHVPLMDILTPSYRIFHSVTPRSVGLHYASFLVPALGTLLLAGFLAYSGYRDKIER